MGSSTYDEEQILQSCLNGDAAAFETIVHKYQSLVCAITYSAIGKVEESEELAQQVFINAWKNLKQLRDASKFKAWLVSITRNIIRDSLRRQRRDLIGQAVSIEDLKNEVEDKTSEPSRNLIAKEQQAVVTQALLQMPESYREPLVLYYRQTQSTKEVADVLELSEDTVRTRLHRGRKMLKEQVASMIETTLSSTAPDRAFTTTVMASLAAIALETASTATAAAGVATVLNTVTAKLVATATLIVVGIGMTVAFKNTLSPSENAPVAQSKSQVVGSNDASIAENSEGNLASRPPEDLSVKPTGMIPSESGEGKISTTQNSSPVLHYRDPNTLTDTHLTLGSLHEDEIQPQWEYLSPNFQGWIFDMDLKPVPNANIYLLGDHNAHLKGRSDPNGQFNFRIPVGTYGTDMALQYPIFVRAISEDYPNQLAWTVIMPPDSNEAPPDPIPSPGNIEAQSQEKRCLGVKGVTLVLEPAATVSGQVRDASNNEPIPNTPISLTGSMRINATHLFDGIAGSGGQGNLLTQTDPNGFYVFTSIPSFAWADDLTRQAEETNMADDSIYRGTSIKVRANAEGYLSGGETKTLKTGESLEDWQVDMSLLPTNITVVGRVVDDYGNPVSGYRMGYCLTQDEHINFQCSDNIRTNKNGEYALIQCPYDRTLSIRAETGNKPHDWDDNRTTNDRDFMYYGYQTVPVPWEEGVYDYEVDIVVETPQHILCIDLKDTAGQPIRGMTVQLRSNDVIGWQWAETLKGITNEDGQCMIDGLPNLAGDSLPFEINPRETFLRSRFRGLLPVDHIPKNPEESPQKGKLGQFTTFSHRIENLPEDHEGYVLEIIVPQEGEQFNRHKRVRAYSLQGTEIK